MKEEPHHYVLQLSDPPRFYAATIAELETKGAQRGSGRKTINDDTTIGKDGNTFSEACEHWTLDGDYLWVTVRSFPDKNWFQPRHK